MINKNLNYCLFKKNYIVWKYKIWVFSISEKVMQNNSVVVNNMYHQQYLLVRHSYKKLSKLLSQIKNINFNFVIVNNWFVYNQLKTINHKYTNTIFINKKKQFKTNWFYYPMKTMGMKIPNIIFSQTKLDKTALQNILTENIPLITNTKQIYCDYSLLINENLLLSHIYGIKLLILQLGEKC